MGNIIIPTQQVEESKLNDINLAKQALDALIDLLCQSDEPIISRQGLWVILDGIDKNLPRFEL